VKGYIITTAAADKLQENCKCESWTQNDQMPTSKLAAKSIIRQVRSTENSTFHSIDINYTLLMT